MALTNTFNYKTETDRYNYYYRRLKVFYQKPVVKVSSAVLFSLATIIFFAIFAIRPTLVTIGELLKKIEDQKIVLEKAETKTASLATAQQLYNAAAASLPDINTAIPPNYQIQQFLLSIEASASKLGIPINNLAISKISYPPNQKNSGSVQELVFTVSFDANYPNAKILISNLGQLPRLVSLDSISFSQETNGESKVSPAGTITVSLNCRLFYYLEKTP